MSLPSGTKRDLIVLVPGSDDEQAMKELLRRHESLRTRPIDFEVIRDAARTDPGCYGRSHELLRPLLHEFEHALVVFDHQGSGQESRGVEEVEREVGDQLRQNGWADRAAVIVIDPELEAWVWGPSRQVDQTLGWRDRPTTLRQWLHKKRLWPAEAPKPPDPKGALEATLRELPRPRSSSIYADLAEGVSLRNCQDRAFLRLVRILRSWFPPSKSGR